MDATLILPNVPPPGSKSFSRINERSNNLYHGSRHRFSSRRKRISAIVEASAITSDPITPQITWQIVVGSIAGVTPFVVAGIEFSKRIVAQKQCVQCGGSGLVLMEKEYIRCPNCGGFLPWQSWKRFFSG
ncbi:uncharacterized protein LOC112500641 [Cynara cardunculus var. scolymus]|uniref:Viral late gene transcription factor 3 zinc ribbon domain-containing protein n=1 Tax=Cynara cardunculus var. scolymus TaxID=59895 RepID=A0A103Y4E9_CYNCS|nr:uncharacterized protein LOC112500641 [Cynara cardunculus var. scolymus]KVI02317.1 hypothetical protein Ccrd_019399 [Cynara cardunculus var. scolymus]